MSNYLYLLGLAGVLTLFLWKKYSSYTKKRNQYIQFLQAQVLKLNANNEVGHVSMEGVPAAVADAIQVADVAEVTVAPKEQVYETEDDPENVPLCDLVAEDRVEATNTLSDCEVSRCQPEPILEFNFVDVPETLYDRATVEVADNDCDGDVVAHNTVGTQHHLIKNSNNSDSDSDSDEVDTGDVIEDEIVICQTKQMHCSATLRSGKRKGQLCGRKTDGDASGSCRIHR
jgi:hypothetical protein